jgi:hypothetical protein
MSKVGDLTNVKGNLLAAGTLNCDTSITAKTVIGVQGTSDAECVLSRATAGDKTLVEFSTASTPSFTVGHQTADTNFTIRDEPNAVNVIEINSTDDLVTINEGNLKIDHGAIGTNQTLTLAAPSDQAQFLDFTGPAGVLKWSHFASNTAVDTYIFSSNSNDYYTVHDAAGTFTFERPTKVAAPFDVVSIDSYSGTILPIGPATATKVEIADTLIDTEVKGNLTVNELTTLVGTTRFGTGATWYEMPTTRGTSGYLLESDGIGGVAWVNHHSSSTGVSTGGVLSINGGDATKFDISDGAGTVTDVTTGEVTRVSWSGLTAQTAAYSGILTYVAINSAGAVVTQATAWTNAYSRDNILLGVLVHVDSVNLVAVNNEQAVITAPTNQIRDMAHAIGFLNVSGNIMSAAATNLTILKSSGEMFGDGINYDINVKDPHLKTLAAIDTSGAGVFQYRYQDGSSSALTLKSVIPGEYDDGNGQASPGTVPNSKYTIQRIYSFVSNALKIQPGQTLYDTQAEALASISTESFITEPSIAANGMLIAYLVMKGNESNLTAAVFIQAGKFGSGGGGGGAGAQSLQQAYTGGNTIDIDALGVEIKDNAVPIGTALLSVQDSAAAEHVGVYADKLSLGDGVDLQHYGQTHQRVLNNSGATIAAGKMVRLRGYDSGTGLMTIEIQPTSADTGTDGELCQGTTAAEILNNAQGYIITGGVFDVTVSSVDNTFYPNFSTGTDLVIGTILNSPETGGSYDGTPTAGDAAALATGLPGSIFLTLETIGAGAGTLPATVKCVFVRSEVY